MQNICLKRSLSQTAVCTWRKANKYFASSLTAGCYESSRGAQKQDVGQWNPDLPDSETAQVEKIPILYELFQSLKTKSDLNLESHTVANKIVMAETCRRSTQTLSLCPLWLHCPSGPNRNNNYRYKFNWCCHYGCCCYYYDNYCDNYCEKVCPLHFSFLVCAWMNMYVLHYDVGAV